MRDEMMMPPVGPNGEKMPPGMVEAFMNAMNGMVEGLERMTTAAEKLDRRAPHVMACSDKVGVMREHRLGARLHLEGLFLIGELEAVERALHALRMEIVGLSVDGIMNIGHTFMFRYTHERTQAVRILKVLNRMEYSARVRLIRMPARILGDSVCRALAVLKNCRMLSSAEYYDLLSPIRLATMCHFLTGVTLDGVDELMCEMWDNVQESVAHGEKGGDSAKEQEARDAIDMERAVRANQVFAQVELSERGKSQLL